MRGLRRWCVLLTVFMISATMLNGCGQVKDAIDSVTSLPSAPVGVAATAGNGTATVSWLPVSGLVKYNIYWSTTPGVTTSTGHRIPDVSAPYSVPGLQNGTRYYFIVTSQNVKGESAPSVEVNATPSESAAPFISATVLSYPQGNLPVASLTMVQVSSTSSDSTAIPNAVVQVNGVNVPWNAAKNEYAANVQVAPGAPVSLQVTVGGRTYSAYGTQFASFPTVTSPATGMVWQKSSPNFAAWTGAAPGSSVYVFGIVNDDGNFVYPDGDGPAELSPTITSSVVPANRLAPGNYYVLTGIGTPGIANGTGTGIAIPGALPGSRLSLGTVGTLSRITVQ